MRASVCVCPTASPRCGEKQEESLKPQHTAACVRACNWVLLVKGSRQAGVVMSRELGETFGPKMGGGITE